VVMDVVQHRLNKCKLCISVVRILFSYQLEGKCLKKVSEEKDLGIVISNDLKMSKQCTQAYAKVIKCLVINRTIKQNYRYSTTVLEVSCTSTPRILYLSMEPTLFFGKTAISAGGR